MPVRWVLMHKTNWAPEVELSEEWLNCANHHRRMNNIHWICCWANMGLFNCTCCAGQLQEHIKEKGIIVSTFAGRRTVQIGAIVAAGVYEQLFKITIWFIRADCWSAGQIYASVQITSRVICRCEIWGAGDEGGAGVQSCRCKCTVVETPGQARGATLCAGKEVPPA